MLTVHVRSFCDVESQEFDIVDLLHFLSIYVDGGGVAFLALPKVHNDVFCLGAVQGKIGV